MTRTGAALIAPSSAARCEIDLSGGGSSVPRTAGPGPEAGVHARDTGSPRSATSASAWAARSAPAIQRMIVARRLVRRRVERHVDDVDRRAPERERDLGDDAGAVGDRDAQLADLAAGQVALEQPPAVVARGVVPGRDAVAVAGGERGAERGQPRERVVDRVEQRVRVGEVDVAPDRGVRAGDARDVAEARAGRGQRLVLLAAASRAAWATSTLASTCGRCDTVASMRSCVSASTRGGARPEPGEQPVQALVERAARLRGRRQVPGGAVEQPGAGVARRRRSRRPRAGGRR